MSSSASRVWTTSGSCGLAAGGDVRAEAAALPLAVAVIVVIIQAAFADPDHARMRGAGDELGGVDMCVLIGLVRVDADGRPDVRFALGGGQHLVPFALAGGDVEHRRDAARPGTGEHGGLLLDKTLVVQMAMAVGEHQASASSRRGKAPTGAGRAVPATIGVRRSAKVGTPSCPSNAKTLVAPPGIAHEARIASRRTASAV